VDGLFACWTGPSAGSLNFLICKLYLKGLHVDFCNVAVDCLTE
jgi:hypothetical protein